MKKIALLTFISALALFGIASAATAQDEPPVATVSIGGTLMSAGPGHAAGDALERMGFDDLYGRRPSPASSTLLHFVIQAHFRVGERRALGFMASGVRGHTDGRRSAPDPARTANAYADYGVDTRAVLYSRWLTDNLRIGAGPALHHSRFLLGSSTGPRIDLGRSRSLGWLADVSLNLPIRERPFHAVEVSLQRRLAGARDIPAQSMPLDSHGASHGTLEWPAMRVNVSHWMVGICLGMRF